MTARQRKTLAWEITMNRKNIVERLNSNDRAVSPVIGVILMVAITVILAAVIGTFVLDLGQSAGNSAPSASLNVDTNVNSNEIAINHKGGDGIDAAQTRLVVTNESDDNSVTWTSAGSADVLSVGGEVVVDASTTPASITSTTWNGMGSSGDSDGNVTGADLKSGLQYSVQIIDTESQRVIYETTVTA